MDKDDFRVRIIWRGNEDKPFYRAHFVSETLRDTLEERPFWGNRVIAAAEFTRLTAIIEESGLPRQSGLIDSDQFGYFVEIGSGSRSDYFFLGFSRQTSDLLEEMNTALTVENREPIRTIIARIRTNIP